MKVVGWILVCGLCCSFLLPAQSVVLVLDGQHALDHFGSAVAGVGDVNGDGVPDLLIGASRDDDAGTDAGRALVISGTDGAVLMDFVGSSPGDRLGVSVAAAGDVNNDGFPDLIVGAEGAQGGAGEARVLSGSDGTLLHLFTGGAFGDLFGAAVASVGDVNGDGFDDVIVGSPGEDGAGINAGAARVYSGFDGSLLLLFSGGSPSARLGASVGGVGDVNGDGIGDVIVGVPGAGTNGTLSGEVRVHSGTDGALLHAVPGGAPFAQAGMSAGGVGDLNQDGRADFAFGAPGAGGTGTVSIVSGLDASVLALLAGDAAGDAFGSSLDGVGDVNGDGVPDLVVGSPGADAAFSDAGSARVFSGADFSILHTFHGAAPGDALGSSVAGAGDLTADGFADLILGTPWASVAAFGAGRVTVVGIDQLVVSAPTQVVQGTSVSFSLSTTPAAPGASYVLDVSLNGSVPGILTPSPDLRTLPLNPPFLNLTYGLDPGVAALFTDFIGVLDASGQAAPAMLIPPGPVLVGLTFSAAAVTLDPAAPLGLGRIGNAVAFQVIP